MRDVLDERIRIGRDGIDLNAEKKGASPFIIHRNYEMGEKVFALGLALSDRHPEFNYRAWVHWMSDAEFFHSPDGVTVRHRDAFFCEQAAKHFWEMLKDHFGLPVRFRPFATIRSRVVV
jgi:hypothetical protein